MRRVRVRHTSFSISRVTLRRKPRSEIMTMYFGDLLIDSSQKLVGRFGFRQFAERVIQLQFETAECAEVSSIKSRLIPRLFRRQIRTEDRLVSNERTGVNQSRNMNVPRSVAEG